MRSITTILGVLDFVPPHCSPMPHPHLDKQVAPAPSCPNPVRHPHLPLSQLFIISVRIAIPPRPISASSPPMQTAFLASPPTTAAVVTPYEPSFGNTQPTGSHISPNSTGLTAPQVVMPMAAQGPYPPAGPYVTTVPQAYRQSVVSTTGYPVNGVQQPYQ